MKHPRQSTIEPFWIDEPDSQISRDLPSLRLPLEIFKWGMIILFLLIPLSFLALISPWLTVYFIIVAALVFTLSVRTGRKRKELNHQILEVQERTRNKIQATAIGSAIHLAGHPRLVRNQSVILALIGNTLQVYPYDGIHPIDSISLDSIIAFQPVVYDDQRVPHVEVIDSAAQAIQIRIIKDKTELVCLFHRMKRMKAIDWYHAVQTAQYDQNLGISS